MTEGGTSGARRSTPALRAVGKMLRAAGVLAALLGGFVALAQAPPFLAPYGAPLACGGVAALVLGLLCSGVATLEQRLIEAELALAETRAELKAAREDLAKAKARAIREPTFRSRPARARL